MLNDVVAETNADFGLIALGTILQIDSNVKGLEKDRKKKSAKKANSIRVDKYGAIKEKLKAYWEINIDPNKKATEAAILLEKTEIYQTSETQPKRGVLEGYVREWQRLRNDTNGKT